MAITSISRRALFPMGLALPGSRAWGRPQASSPGRPNFVIIFADDLGYGDLGCYGHPTIRTPHLDTMARQGVRFTQFYAAAPACSPSRAALLTGRLPVRTGVNNVLNPWSSGGLPATETTIAKALKPMGYGTACVGKWHLGHHTAQLPLSHGFDSYFGIPYSNDMSKATAGNPGFIRELEKHPEVGGTPLIRGNSVVEVEPDQSQITRRYTDESIRFIRQAARARQPFFLYLAHTMPHHPLSASARFRGRSPRGLYGDVIEELDDSVGQIRRTLEELKLDRNTLVVFASDNGPWLVKGPEGGSAGLLRDGKGTIWEGGFRVPGIASWPGMLPAGVTSTMPASTMDLLPTILKAAGAPLPAAGALDGEDLLPLVNAGATRDTYTFFYYNGIPLRAVRKGPWKLVLEQPNVPAQLYHLDQDPSERFDRAATEPAVVGELTRVIAQHRRELVPGSPQS